MKLQETISTKVHDYYWNQDLNCAITTLQLLSELFSINLHPQVIQGTFGLNAGRSSSQCGLVQGTLLFIGIYGYQQEIELAETTILCRKFSSEFQHHFSSLLCNQLRPQGFPPDNPLHLCENLTILAITFSAEFIQREFNHHLLNNQ